MKDRINYSCFSSEIRSSVNLLEVLPNNDDYGQLRENITTLVSRISVKYVDVFKDDFNGVPTRHIPHRFSKYGN